MHRVTAEKDPPGRTYGCIVHRQAAATRTERVNASQASTFGPRALVSHGYGREYGSNPDGGTAPDRCFDLSLGEPAVTITDDPFAETANTDDPFASADDVRSASGPFVPKPFLDALAGRLVAMVPRSYEKEAAKRADRIEQGGATTEERYTVDMAVLDGGDLAYWYNAKVEGSEERELTEHTIPAAELPVLYTGVWRTEGNIIGQLKRIDGKARPILLGRVRRAPQSADRKKGVTTEQVETAYAAWEKRGKNGPKPKFSWIMDVDAVTDADRALAGKWYQAAVAEGFTL